MNAFLSDRQRAPIVVDRSHARLGTSAGGVDRAHPMTLAAGLVDQQARYPATLFDRLIRRDRGPYFQKARVIPPGNAWVSWTGAGPARPELHARNQTWRREVGSSNSRFPVVDSPTTGMHTMTPSTVARTLPRYVETQQMLPPRQNRLSNARYSGQTYSQTTVVQGRR